MKKPRNPKSTVIFVVLAAILMVFVKFMLPALFETKKSPSFRPPSIKSPEQISQQLEEQYFQYEQVYRQPKPLVDQSLIEAAKNYEDMESWIDKKEVKNEQPLEKITFQKKKYVAPRPARGHPHIAIIIDDMGMDKRRSRAMMEMTEPLTLSFLPYAPGVSEMASIAHKNGHELMIHMPMQAVDSRLTLGAIALRAGMSETDMDQQLEAAFSSFSQYKGLNNHMGSRLTQDLKAMSHLMQRLKEKGLYFIDSKTINTSVAADAAKSYGLATGERDVFLDHVNSIEFARGALRELEVIAERKGYAIAIGHPKEITIAALKEWLPDAQARGFKIVPASALVSRPKEDSQTASSSVYGPPEILTIDSDPLDGGVNVGPLLAQ